MMNRKKFIRYSSSLMVGASLSGNSFLNAATFKTEKGMPIVDTHQHLVDFKRFGEGWSHPPVPGNFGIREYQKAIKGLNITKAVYMEVNVPEDKRHEEALYAIELCKDSSNPTVAAVIKGDFYMRNFEEYIAEFKNSPYIKGIRCKFHSHEGLEDDQVIKNVRALGKINMSLDLLVSPAWLSTIIKLIQNCPDTRFIIDHCGNADPRAFLQSEGLFGKSDHNQDEWIAGMKAIAAEKNVVCKISGLVSRFSGYSLNADNLAPAINYCLDIFGPDRVMFAGDWPWCLKGIELGGWVNILKSVVAKRTHESQRKLFYDNAIKFYNI